MSVFTVTSFRTVSLIACGYLLTVSGSGMQAAVAEDRDVQVLTRIPDWDTRAAATAVAFEGSLACVGYGDGGVRFVDIRDPVNPRVLGRLSQVGQVNDVALDDGFAYLATDSFMIVDASDPAWPRVISAEDWEVRYSRVMVSGQRAYLIGGANRLEIMDVKDGRRPEKLGEYTDLGGIAAMAIQGNLACLAHGYSFSAVDISNTARPVMLGKLQLDRPISDVALRGDKAFASVRGYPQGGMEGGWCVIDVADPKSPKVIREELLRDVSRIVIEGNRAWLACGRDGVRRYDISNPLSPGFLDRCDTPGEAIDLAIAGGLVLVADGYAGLQAIEYSSLPRSLTQHGTYGVGEEIVISEGKAFVAERIYSGGTSWGASALGGGLRIFDVHDPLLLRELSYYTASASEPVSFTDVAVTGNQACVAAGSRGVMILDVANPENPRRLASVSDIGEVVAIATSRDYAYAASSTAGRQPAGLVVIDLSDPAHPSVMGSWPTPRDRRAVDVAVSGTIACLAMGNSELQIIDVSDPAQPEAISVVTNLVGIRSVAMSGNNAYAVGVAFWVIDLQNPASPRMVGSYPVYAFNVQVSGQRAYLAAGSEGWLILDVSDPASPRRMGSAPSDFVTTAIAGTNDFAFGVGWSGQLTPIHLGNPGNPSRLATLPLEEPATAIAVANGYAYLALSESDDGKAILSILDVRDAMSPVTVRRTSSVAGDWIQRLAVGGDYLYLAVEDSGLQVLDIRQPEDPVPVAHLPVPGEDLDLALAGDVALLMSLVEDGPDFLHLIDVADPTNPRLLASQRIKGSSRSISADGHIAYLHLAGGGPGEGMWDVIDFSDPSNPRLLPWWSGQAPPAGVLMGTNGMGYRPSLHGIEVLDVRDRGRVRRLGGNTGFPADAIAMDERYLYVATRHREFLVLEHFQPTRLDFEVAGTPAEVALLVTGPAGLRLRVQRSADLRTWDDVETRILNGDTTRIVDGSADESAGRRFYRTISP